MEIRSNIFQRLLFLSTFTFLVESGTAPSADDSTAATSMGTCALLMYGNALIVSINLCSNKTNCPYLSNGVSFTAWIDVTLEKTLRVWLISGSYPQARRPLKPLIEYPNFTLPVGAGENVSLFFRGSSCKNQERAYETSSWSFNAPVVEEKAIPFSKRDKYWNKHIIGAGGVAGVVATFLIVFLLSLCLATHHPSRAMKDCLGRRVFRYTELCTATKNFSKTALVGRGGFGTVYRGSLQRFENTLVAVKRIRYDSMYAQKTFRAEISCLTKIQHKNVVQLLGWCHEKGRLLLVYEYISNGSLYEWLHGCQTVLSWKLRQTILEGVASAIEFLHSKCPQLILHRNIRSSNVILDVNFEAHLGDFGLAHLVDHEKQYRTTTAGEYLQYMAPEMPYTGKATKESDVYSFGILILEVVCGKHPLDREAMEGEDLMLLFQCWRAHEAGNLLNMADPKLFQTFEASRLELLLDESTRSKNDLSPSSSYDSNIFGEFQSNISNLVVKDDVEAKKMIIENLLHLGLLCCLFNPKARPTIEQVVEVLKQIGSIDDVESMITNVSISSFALQYPIWASLKFT